MFVDWVNQPVNSRIVSYGVAGGVNANHLEIFVSSVLSYPIAV